jgi:hypothetical protein
VESELISTPDRLHEMPGGRAILGRMGLALPLAAIALGIWLLADLRTPDLAAQVYRTGLFERSGFSLWDTHWYAGHHLPGYSLIFPTLASLVGTRLLAVLCVLASSVMFERLVLRAYPQRARFAAAWFALAATGDAWIGRLTFVLGVTLAIAAVLALTNGHRARAAALSLLCAAASPVAGLLLGMAALTYAIATRSLRTVVVLLAPALILASALALLFPEGGYEPFPVLSFAASTGVTLSFWWALPKDARLARVGALIYLLAATASLLIHTPMGSNIERYGVLLCGPLLICATGERLRPRVLLALCAIAVWSVWGPVRETVAVANNASTKASYYEPVRRFIAGHGRALVRLEVPLTRSHWESALLAPYVSLARGWEKQLDERYDAVLLSGRLTPGGYRRWLENEAVSYVALPDTPLDPSSRREGALIRAGLPYLRLVFSSSHWRIYQVLDPTPLLSGPGRLTSLTSDSFALHADRAGTFLLRIHYTRYWMVTKGRGCVVPGYGGWTSISAHQPGTLKVQANLSLSAALDLGNSSCS